MIVKLWYKRCNSILYDYQVINLIFKKIIVMPDKAVIFTREDSGYGITTENNL